MKYVSRGALEQILIAFRETSLSKLPMYKTRDDQLRCESKIQAYEAVLESLDSVEVIEIDEETV